MVVTAMGGDLMECLHGLKPVALMVVVQVFFAGVNIFYKLAINDGMSLRILVAYRYIFATAFLGPLALSLERSNRPPLTLKILGLAFACGLFGGTLAQNLYIASLTFVPTTYAAATTNLVPAITFIMAVIFRMESLLLQSPEGLAKVAGAAVGIGGAMLLTFYKGVELTFWPSGVDLMKHSAAAPAAAVQGNHVIGSLLAVASCFSYAIWLIIQAKFSEMYPCHYSSTALMSLMGSIQAMAYTFCVEKDLSAWKLGNDIRLLTVFYVGVFASGISITLISWTIKRKGPLFVSIFNPVMLVVVAIASSFLLNERLYLGSVLGACLIVVGLYLVLWGKGRDMGDSVHLPVRSMSSRSERGSTVEPVDNVVSGGATVAGVRFEMVLSETKEVTMPVTDEEVVDSEDAGDDYDDKEVNVSSSKVVISGSNLSVER